MKNIDLNSLGIVPGKEIGSLLPLAFAMAKNEASSLMVFQKGIYYIDCDLCSELMLYITNTVGDREFSSSETPHLQRVGFYLEGINNLTVDGGGSVFVIKGKMTNMALVKCKNITLKNMTIRHSHPDMHEMRVIKKTAFSVEFTFDKDTNTTFKDGKPYFTAKGFSYPADKGAATANWIPLIRQANESYCCRVKHPLAGAIKYKDGEDSFTAFYLSTSRFKLGDRFYVYDVRRQFVGIFINECEGITLENIVQSFNYSLGVVMQCSSDITVSGCSFVPDEKSGRLMTSCADFIQCSMCRGTIKVSGCDFVGAGDDCMNVHGIHFKITEIKDSTVKLSFMHEQTHGFDPFKKGDTVAFIDTKALREKSSAVVESSRLLNEKEILLTLSGEFSTNIGDAVENVTACPDVIFQSNKLSRIVTRGLLLTTRGKVQIENNHFISTAMSGILLSDDANSWYESGMCKDVLIKGNTFELSGEPTILIKPENKVYEGAVHENIRIIDNTFNVNNKCQIDAYSSDNILIKGNNLAAGSVNAKKCNNIKIK